jgi:3-deoxy-manno-octulosonate cytidylyltransferase (CMP-KDO synthetase)
MPKSIIVIPARMASSRYPNKPLASILNIPMIKRVWMLAKLSQKANKVVVATDDPSLAEFVSNFADVVMTSHDCQTGTDRVADALSHLQEDFDIVFSLQGDAVLTPPWVIDDVLSAMIEDKAVQIATPAVLLQEEARASFIESKSKGISTGTSVVFDKHKNALYFSKNLIPFARDKQSSYPIYRHIGLYGYLKTINALPQTPLEKIEQLEQLRALENGIPIRVVPVDYKGRTHGAVDRPEDVATIEQIIQREGELIYG